jgi:hypothetical protein
MNSNVSGEGLDRIGDIEGKLVAGSREQASKRASLKVPDNPRLLCLPTEASAKVGVFSGDRSVAIPDSCPFTSITRPHFYIRKLRGEVPEKFLDTNYSRGNQPRMTRMN